MCLHKKMFRFSRKKKTVLKAVVAQEVGCTDLEIVKS